MENLKRPKPIWINEFSSNDSLHMFSELVEECSTKTTFQEICSTKSTKESICDDAFRKAEVNEELEACYETLHSLEAQISKLMRQKSKLTINNKKLQHEFKNSKLELQAVELLDTASDVNKKLQEQKKALLQVTQLCRKQTVRLEGLKCRVEEKCAELAEKEDELSGLIENRKILKVRLLRASSCKSLDISKLQVSLDVIHTNLERKDACNVSEDYGKNELKEYLDGSLEKFKKLDKKGYQRKLDESLEKYTEVEQKIAKLKINYQNSRRKIILDHQRVKEDLIELLKKRRQDLYTNEKDHVEKEKERYAQLIKIADEEQIAYQECQLKAEVLSSHAAKMKKDLVKVYMRIKTKRRERFRISEAIDARGLEIDDIRLEIDKLRALVMM